MTHDDLEFALTLTTREGWHSTRRDFEELLTHDNKGSFVGEIDQEPVGMVCTVYYGPVGFIGNLIVEEACRGNTCGRELMEYGMQYLKDHGTRSIFLDGVPGAVPLYERLGFRKICKSLRLEVVISIKGTSNSRLMREEDLQAVFSLDSSLFGVQREDFLRMRFDAYPEFCRVIESENELQGYIMGNISGDKIRIGPWVMREDGLHAEQLLIDMAPKVGEKIIKIGVLETNSKALKILRKYGFRESSYSWRMFYGDMTTATLSNQLYAIACPARG